MKDEIPWLVCTFGLEIAFDLDICECYQFHQPWI